MKDSIAENDKKILDYLREQANNLKDFIERNNIRVSQASVVYITDKYGYLTVSLTHYHPKTHEPKTITVDSYIKGEWTGLHTHEYERNADE